MNQYERYFSHAQTGRGVSDIGAVYSAPHRLQRGRGLSDVFSGIFKFLSPYILSSTKAIGREALRSGSEILKNIGNQPVRELLKTQAMQSTKNLSEKAATRLKRMSDEMTVGGAIKRRNIPIGLINSLERATTRSMKRKAAVRKLKGRKRKTKKTRTKRRRGGVVKKRRSAPKKKKSKSKSAFLKQYLAKQ